MVSSYNITARQRIPKEVELPCSSSCQGWHGEKTGGLIECDEDGKEGLGYFRWGNGKNSRAMAIAAESNFGIKQCFS